MSNWTEKKNSIESYYTGLIQEHGHSPRACDYGRPESQDKKFRVLAEAMNLNNKTVLDVGCGFAHFSQFLANSFDSVDYHGVDITQEFVTQARTLHPDVKIDHADILNDDLGRTYDFVTANGIFYLLGQDAKQLMHDLITRMFALTHDTVAFNSLSSWCDDKESGEFYADPLETLEFCRTLSPWVTLRHDYHTRDFTIYMRKDQVS